jgi:hypothetical protein
MPVAVQTPSYPALLSPRSPGWLPDKADVTCRAVAGSIETLANNRWLSQHRLA